MSASSGENDKVVFINDKLGGHIVRSNTENISSLIYNNKHYDEKTVINEKVKNINNGDVVALTLGSILKDNKMEHKIDFDLAYNIYKRQILCGVKVGVGAIVILGLGDLYEAKAAVLAAKENSNLPIYCVMKFINEHKTTAGCIAPSVAITLEGLGVDYIGICGTINYNEIITLVKTIKSYSNGKLIIQGSFNENQISNLVNEGVSGFLDCEVFTVESKTIEDDEITKSYICSPRSIVCTSEVQIIGERINPSRKKDFIQALINDNISYVLNEGIKQVKEGANILDINLTCKGINEARWMKSTVIGLQSIIDEPLQIDTINIETLEAGLRYYNGKPIINSVNGIDSVLDKVLPVAKKYGAAIVALTIDEKGIPATAEERVSIAKKVLRKALSYGIKKEDVYIDTLAMPVSADPEINKETFKALKIISSELKLNTILGISNVSFGMDKRESTNEEFLDKAMSCGLVLPIMNTKSKAMIDIVKKYRR